MYNILFHSVYSDLCRDLIFLLRNEGFLQYFKLICVDEDLENCPVNVVPTMIVKGLRKPLEGNETLKWVEQAKYIRQNWIMNMKKSIIQHNMMKMMMQNRGGPLGFSNNEMGGFSDDYAYTDVDRAVAHVFFGYGEEKKNAIFTAEEVEKIREGDSDQLIKKLEKMRAGQDSNREELFEKQQLAAVIQHERNTNIPEMTDKQPRIQQNPSKQQQMMQQQRMMQQQQQMMQQKMLQQKMLQQQMMKQRMMNGGMGPRGPMGN